MGFKDILEKIGEEQKRKKAYLKQLDEQMRFQKIMEDRQKSSNQRELERYLKEEQEKEIKESLDFMRKKREYDINFGHNPLNAENITNKKGWEVLKESNQFKNKGCMFSNQKSVLKSNKNLLKSNKNLNSMGCMFVK